MNQGTLIKANDLDRKIRDRQGLIDHFKRPVDDPVKEVQELLTGYNNLMSGFNRVKIAEFMIVAFSDHTKKELQELEKELEDL